MSTSILEKLSNVDDLTNGKVVYSSKAAYYRIINNGKVILRVKFKNPNCFNGDSEKQDSWFVLDKIFGRKNWQEWVKKENFKLSTETRRK